MNNQEKLIVNAHFDIPSITREGGIRHLVVDLTSPKLVNSEENEANSLNLGVVIDASGSMSASVSEGRLRGRRGNRFDSCLEAAKAAAIGVVESLGKKDRLSIVSFSDDAQVHISGQVMDDGGRREAIEEITRMHTRGSTNLHDGWLKGAEEVALLMDENEGYQNRVVILSDGHANQGIVEPEALGEIAGGLRERGITSSTVGIGVHYSTDQLEQIAIQGGGMLHHAQEPGEIVEVVLGELGSMKNTFAENLVFECSLPPGVGGRIIGLPFHSDRDGLRCPVGFLMSEQSRQVVVHLDIPGGLTQLFLDFDVKLRWKEVADGGKQKTHSETVTLPVGEEADLDVEIGQMVVDMWSSEVIQRAMVMNREGDYEGVDAYWRIQIAAFKAYCVDLPDTEELLKKLERTWRSVRRPMPEYARKEVHTAQLKMMRSVPDAREDIQSSSWEKFLDK